jgi:hypothetical protein
MSRTDVFTGFLIRKLEGVLTGKESPYFARLLRLRKEHA